MLHARKMDAKPGCLASECSERVCNRMSRGSTSSMGCICLITLFALQAQPNTCVLFVMSSCFGATPARAGLLTNRQAAGTAAPICAPTLEHPLSDSASSCQAAAPACALTCCGGGAGPADGMLVDAGERGTPAGVGSPVKVLDLRAEGGQGQASMPQCLPSCTDP